jgi:hypothetical protein
MKGIAKRAVHRCRNRAPHRRRKRKQLALQIYHTLPIFLLFQPFQRCQQATLVSSERARRTRCLLHGAPAAVRRLCRALRYALALVPGLPRLDLTACG